MKSRYLGTITMSMPALIARPLSGEVAGSIWSMAAQSETTKPENPSSPLSTSVIRHWWPCIAAPFQRVYDIMTRADAALIAAA